MQKIIKPAPEQRYADELKILQNTDFGITPRGWLLAPKAVRAFILGDKKLKISRKFYGPDAAVERMIVSLLGNQALMLVGEPGTAKTLLSELLATAISGDSGLTIQGSAGTTEEQIGYSWNYALLLAEGPSQKALLPSPVYQGMQNGKIVRFEELTRCPPEIQDILISLLSDKQLLVSEWQEKGRIFAKPGFNLIATANLRDRGVHEMSSALKRRFNFETVHPIADQEQEVTLVMQQLQDLIQQDETDILVSVEIIELLVSTFRELRAGRSQSGAELKVPDAIMSTAEAVNVAWAASLQSCYLGSGSLRASDLAAQFYGVVIRDNPADRHKLQHYFDTIVKERARKSALWKEFYQAAGKMW